MLVLKIVDAPLHLLHLLNLMMYRDQELGSRELEVEGREERRGHHLARLLILRSRIRSPFRGGLLFVGSALVVLFCRMMCLVHNRCGLWPQDREKLQAGSYMGTVLFIVADI